MFGKSYQMSAIFIIFCIVSLGGFGAKTATAGNLFQPYVTLATGSCAQAVAIGDMNNDGLNDVVVATGDRTLSDPDNDNRIHIFLQQPDGSLAFSAKYPIVPTYATESMDVGDLNNDGRNDVVVSASNSIGIFLQNDAATFDPMVSYATSHSSGTNCYRVRIGDFNNDGLLDVVSIDWGTQSYDVDVFLQNAEGTMNPPVVYVVNHGGHDDLKVGDVNDDGLEDIVVMSGQGLGDTLGILLQNASGTMNGPIYYDLTDNALTNGVAVGDINDDALQDVIVTYNYNIGAFYQNASGTLDASVSYSSSGDTKPVEIGDVNGDGKNDVVSAGGPTLEVHLQGSDGQLLPYEIYTIPYETFYPKNSLAIGDINDDGLNDVALANCGYGLVVLYASDKLPPAPDIKANGSDGPLYVTRWKTVSVTVSLDPGSSAGVAYDWWIGANTPYGTYWLNSSRKWVRSTTPVSVGQYGLLDLPATQALRRTLPVGTYSFFFTLDGKPNGEFDDTAATDSITVVSQ